MQELIAAYLFQNSTCPLPGLGTLTVATRSSESDFVHKQIKAPVQVIAFSEAETDNTELINYISLKSDLTSTQAEEELQQLAVALKAGGIVQNVGSFTVDSSGKIIFTSEPVPKYFTPAVHAERVVRPEANHNILVGDKETTAAVMTEYYAEESPKKDYWWVWAIILAAIAVAVIVIYLNDKSSSAYFGNAISYSQS